ncbi:hypothetical protein CGLO_18397 [Colletotrichum gloeosporioides Cg-14]|uniref:Uncharacterized protein n=1 Tax=Colletotrichum gloeosporioides (strain Cg-14) TaxID=1237896 RepID=T0JRS4_COLGC|nr:hypothetical protein CGLO_18397 [Colletotrichum gloeosporioides Cg-14]
MIFAAYSALLASWKPL